MNDSIECIRQFKTWNISHTGISTRFVYTGIFGTLVAMVGLVVNLVNIAVLVQKTLQSAYATFLLALGIMDLFIFVEYFVIFVVESYVYQFRWKSLWFFWLWHIRVTFWITRATQAMSVMVMILATTERCLAITATSFWRKYFTHHNIVILLFTCAFLALTTRFVSYFEIIIGQCPEYGNNMASIYLDRSALAHDETYKIAYTLFFAHFILIVVPFLLLLGLNTCIIRAVRQALLLPVRLIERTITVQHEQARRSSTRSLVVTSCSYLFCYSLQFVISIMELANPEFLRRHRVFYFFGRETINFMTILNSAIRPLIYYATSDRYKDTARRLVKIDPSSTDSGRSRRDDRCSDVSDSIRFSSHGKTFDRRDVTNLPDTIIEEQCEDETNTLMTIEIELKNGDVRSHCRKDSIDSVGMTLF